MNEIPTPRMHSMACNFPEGCSCGAAEYNRLLDALTTARAALEATEKERDKLIQQEELVENAIPGGEFEGSEDTNGEIVATIVSQRDTALAELAKVKAELEELSKRLGIRADDAIKLAWNVEDTQSELSRLRSECAAKDAALHCAICLCKNHRVFERDEFTTLEDTCRSALSVTPPVCVPVEVVAKLVEALDWLIKECFLVPETDNVKFADALSALALAAPFLAKGSV